MVKKIYHMFMRSINEITNNAEGHLINLGWFLIIVFPIFYFINRSFIGLVGYENIFLRLSIGVLGAILVIRYYLPKKLMSFMPTNPSRVRSANLTKPVLAGCRLSRGTRDDWSGSLRRGI